MIESVDLCLVIVVSADPLPAADIYTFTAHLIATGRTPLRRPAVSYQK